MVTRGGRITIPAEIRRAFSIAPGDRIRWMVEGSEAWPAVAPSAIARSTGKLAVARPDLSAEELRAEAEKVISKAVVERSP